MHMPWKTVYSAPVTISDAAGDVKYCGCTTMPFLLLHHEKLAKFIFEDWPVNCGVLKVYRSCIKDIRSVHSAHTSCKGVHLSMLNLYIFLVPHDAGLQQTDKKGPFTCNFVSQQHQKI